MNLPKMKARAEKYDSLDELALNNAIEIPFPAIEVS
ncbi:hypothetical protein AAKU61_004216 [Undibacterium sp. GrIS 1.2]